MVYHHHTFRCPVCNEVAEKVTTTDNEQLYGSPFRICPHCQSSYFNSKYKEKGLEYFQDKGGELSFWGVAWFLFSNIAFFYFAYICFTSWLEGDFDSNLLIPLAGVGILAIIFDVGIVRMIKNRIHHKEYLKKQIDLIEGRGRNRSESLIESMERLSDKKYLDALKNRGVTVPQYFYDRLSDDRLTRPAEKRKTVKKEVVSGTSSSSKVEKRKTAKNEEVAEANAFSEKVSFCRNCGARVESDSNFCANCGTKIAR